VDPKTKLRVRQVINLGPCLAIEGTAMIQALILICSIYVPPQNCDRHHAIDSTVRSVPFGISGMAGQVELADNALGPDTYHYEKIITTR
jgi:hypothetical protein